MIIKITEKELSARKKRITHEAFRLFCQHGISKVSVRDIADQAEVAEKSIYRYFGTKTELVMETVSMLWKEIVTELYADLGEGYSQKTGLEQVQVLLSCFGRLFEGYSEYVLFSYEYKLFLLRHFAFLTEQEYGDEIRPVYVLYTDAIKKGIQDGSIQAAVQDTEKIYYAVWGLIRGYIVKMVIYDRMYEGDNLWLRSYQIACSIILGGLKSGMLL